MKEQFKLADNNKDLQTIMDILSKNPNYDPKLEITCFDDIGSIRNNLESRFASESVTV